MRRALAQGTSPQFLRWAYTTQLNQSSSSIAASQNVVWRISDVLRNQYSTSSSGDAKQLFNSLQNADFQRHLDDMRRQTSVIPYGSLISEFRTSIPSASDEEAKRACQALIESGSVVRYGDLVFLKPNEIADALQRVIPSYGIVAESELARAKLELQELEERRQGVEKRARLRSTLLNWGFFGFLTAQWGLLFRLTYWELSWDVIEPVTCFLGGFTSLASYAFFLSTRRDFSYEAMTNKFSSGYQQKLAQRIKFDPSRYEQLQRDVQRYTEVLQAQKQLPAAGEGATAK